ncbi:MAG: ribonuclease P protein component [Zoogloeaceae bacterium]|jgi:ribonuclease P protein component|nr:ribonuclease P protein component [Zoogloeaceae bacterium]
MRLASRPFPRSCRLLRADEYAAVFSFRRALRGEHFLLHYGEERKEGEEGARLGLVIGKKFMRRAVGRNTVKRVAREAFRQMRVLLPCRDWVLRLATKLPKPDRALRRELAAEISQLLTRAADRKP